MCFKFVVKCWEEVVSGQCFCLVDCNDGVLHGLAFSRILVDESDGLFVVGLQREDHLEEGIGDTYLMFVADIIFLFVLVKVLPEDIK